MAECSQFSNSTKGHENIFFRQMTIIEDEEEQLWAQEEHNWDDFEDDESPIQCLFCASQCSAMQECFQHMKDVHRFDFIKYRTMMQLEFYDCVKLINYLRISCANGESETAVNTLLNASSKEQLPREILDSDDLLLPALDNDRFLCEFDDVIVEENEGKQPEQTGSIPIDWEEKYQQLLKDFSDYKIRMSEWLTQNSVPIVAHVDESHSDEKPDYYFQSYSYNDIHEDMLKDRVRTDSYRDFVYLNKHLFKDKVVLDVGCGTGILSMFAAKAGAKRVYAVDNSEMIEKCRQIVKDNQLDSQIQCIRCRVEDIQLDSEKVDLIISEWMGYGLLYEAMFDSVLVARDKWLKPDGIMAPSHASMYIAAVQDDQWMNERFYFWNNVYGFDMSTVQKTMLTDRNAIVDCVGSDECVLSSVATLRRFDCKTVSSRELDFSEKFEMSFTATNSPVTVQMFVLWFDVEFVGGHHEVRMSTAPTDTSTHWKQVIMLLDEPLQIESEKNIISGQVTVCKSTANHRDLVIELTYALDNGTPKQKTFTLQ